MPEVIWKFPLGPPDTDGISRIETDQGRISDVLSFGVEGTTIVCWATVFPEVGYRDSREFLLANTGAPYKPSLRGVHLATVKVGEIVWHIFAERPPF